MKEILDPAVFEEAADIMLKKHVLFSDTAIFLVDYSTPEHFRIWYAAHSKVTPDWEWGQAALREFALCLRHQFQQQGEESK